MPRPLSTMPSFHLPRDIHRFNKYFLNTCLLEIRTSTGSRRAGSVVVTHGPSCSAACGIFPDQGPNPCPLHWQADSQPLRHQGSPEMEQSCP
ncbi:hypothetical protein J1605_018519 [Eschrichtius robustus]|uniref:Uncharacterized protein n=1 Tax=Eschrichtius robustus TaxID=9764 RepID=A0AB34HSI9_ESCRO|nr:hypothetical protein J1605_018519 [Eschrichtius robustus]